MIKDKKEKENKKLEQAIQEIKDKFGEGSIMKLKDLRAVDVDAIPTGSISLDLALGIGGVPRGRIIEIFGPESAGKTSLALHIIAESQKRKGIGAFIDAEHALDPEYAKKIGVNLEELLISQPNSGEQALQIVETLAKSKRVDVIVIDSVAALAPKAEIEGEMGEQQIGLQARLMSHALRKLSAVVSDSNTCVIFLNQIRMKIGVFFGNPETTPGGLALKFYSSVRVELRRLAQIKQGDKIIGNRIKARIVKNKVAAPFRSTELDIFYNEGISRLSDIINTGVSIGVIKKQGSSLLFQDAKLGVGMDQTKTFLKESPEIERKIVEEIKKSI